MPKCESNLLLLPAPAVCPCFLNYLDLYWNVIRVSSSNTNGRTNR